MNLFLVFVMSTLIAVFVFFLLENRKIKISHQNEVARLKALITELLQIQSQQQGALQLSDELKFKLQQSRVEIDKKLINLQGELIEIVAINGLADSI